MVKAPLKCCMQNEVVFNHVVEGTTTTHVAEEILKVDQIIVEISKTITIIVNKTHPSIVEMEEVAVDV